MPINNISSFSDKAPIIHKTAFIDPSARVIGDVTLKQGVSIWPMAVLRADSSGIFIGKRTALLDQSLVESPEGFPVTVGNLSIISHGAILHGAHIGPNVLVGVGAIVLDGAFIGRGSIVGAGSIVTSGTTIPQNSLVFGSPGKIVRKTTREEREYIINQIEGLYQKSRVYLREQMKQNNQLPNLNEQ